MSMHGFADHFSLSQQMLRNYFTSCHRATAGVRLYSDELCCLYDRSSSLSLSGSAP